MDKEPAMRDPQTKPIELEERLIDFAVRIIRLTAHLPKTPAGKHIAGQILRSETSPAPNYGEARGAESRADFAHKIGIVLKELNETSIWLRVIDRSEMLKKELLSCSDHSPDQLQIFRRVHADRAVSDGDDLD